MCKILKLTIIQCLTLLFFYIIKRLLFQSLYSGTKICSEMPGLTVNRQIVYLLLLNISLGRGFYFFIVYYPKVFKFLS